MRYFCPKCFDDWTEANRTCPRCGTDIPSYEATTPYTQKLIEALGHPEAETVIRVAGILGDLQEVRAVGPLIALFERTPDVYIARAAAGALGTIGTPEALDFLETIRNHVVRMVREEVESILAKRLADGTHPRPPPRRSSDASGES